MRDFQRKLPPHLWPLITLFVCLTGGLFAQDDWSKNNHFTIFGEFVFLQRTGLESTSIVLDSNKDISQQTMINSSGNEVCCNADGVCCNPNFTVLKTGKLVKCFNFEPGYRVGVSYLFDREACCAPYYASLTLSYMSVQQWQGEKSRYGIDSLSFPFEDLNTFSDYYGADKAVGKYTSKFDDLEFNYTGYVTPPREDFFSFSGIIGFRYIYLKEFFEAAFSKNIAGSYSTSTYKIDTWNNMYGGQLGADLTWNPTCNISWDWVVKLAAFANWARAKTFLGDIDNRVVIRDFELKDWRGALLFDFVFSLTYTIAPHIALKAGYQFLYFFGGVALAPEQIEKKLELCGDECLCSGGTPQIQGGFVGLRIGF
jgi:hypothetical protein